MKICNKCGIEKEKTSFSWSNKEKGYYKSSCRTCISAIEKETKPWRKRAKYKGGLKKEKRFSSNREAHLWYAYKLTQDDYNNIMEKQGNRCAICQKVPKVFVVDHCHETGDIRGLLCHNCNIGLGLLGDTKESLSKAYGYLL